MTFDKISQDIAEKVAVEILKTTIDAKGGEYDVLDKTEQVLLGVLLANERLFGTNRQVSIEHMSRMSRNVAHRMAPNGHGNDNVGPKR